MKELVEHIAKSLADKPEEVSVKVTENGPNVALELHLAPDDLGRVIGKQGRTARSFRTIVTAAGIKGKKRVTLEIQE